MGKTEPPASTPHTLYGPNPPKANGFSVICTAAVCPWKNQEIVLHMFSCMNKCRGANKKKKRCPHEKKRDEEKSSPQGLHVYGVMWCVCVFMHMCVCHAFRSVVLEVVGMGCWGFRVQRLHCLNCEGLLANGGVWLGVCACVSSLRGFTVPAALPRDAMLNQHF